MFVLLITYTKPVDEVDRHMQTHRDWLARHFASGCFLMAGRKEPRTGGVILATADSRSEIEAIVAQDSFTIEQVASYEIVEFAATTTAESLAWLKAG
ncbi:YciI family protein [soil metagenome]